MPTTHILTTKGAALKAKQELGQAEPNITRVVAGAGYVAPELLPKLTEIPEPISEMQMGERRLIDGHIAGLPVQLSNIDLDGNVLVSIIGVYALDPDEGEILYQVCQYDSPVPIPAYRNGEVVLFEPELNIAFSNTEAADIPLTPDFLVTAPRLQEHDVNLEAHENRFEAMRQGLADKAPLVHGHDAATTGKPGFLSAVDKAKLNNVPADTNAQLSNKANKTPPIIYNIPLSSGITANTKCSYSKTQEGIVHLYLDIHKSSGNFTTNEVVANIPAGYRIHSHAALGGCFWKDSTGYSIAIVSFYTNGQIVIDVSAIEYSYLRIALSYPAAQ